MALIHSKQFNPRFTGSFTLSGSFLGDSNSSASFGRIVGTTFVGDGGQLTGITSVTTSSIQNLKAGIVSGSSQIISISDSAPSSPAEGDLWWKSDDGNLYVYYDGYWVISIDTTTALPAGVISGSSQLPSGIISSSIFTAVTSSGNISSSANLIGDQLVIGGGTFTSASLAAGGAAASTTYNGNRRIIQTRFPTLFSASFNPGTSGSISDFLDAVFYPNTAPSVSSSRFTLDEFVSPNVNVGTINATDAEALSGEISFATQSGYSDGFFTIHSGSGLVKTNTSTSASFNTVNRGDGQFAHPFLIEVSDTITTSQATIFIRVTPNTTPKFRTTSVEGSEINAQTGSVNENTTNSTQILEFFVTDSEDDTLSISPLSQSAANRFSMATANVAGGKRIRITTATASFDFETITQHHLEVSASDEHHGNTSGSYLTTLPILVNVTDNLAPTMASQVFTMEEASGSHENHGQGANTNSLTTVGTITTNDNEGDTVTFLGLTLTSGSGGGNTSQTDTSNNPFQVTSAGVLQLKAGQFLNSDLFDQYKYTATYKDLFNNASSSGVITVNITPDPIPTLTNNAGTTYNGDDLFYIIESATNGNAIRVNSNGRTGTQGDFNSNETVYFTTTGSPYVAINSSNGNLSVGTNISGSVFNFDNTSYITGSVTASNNFGTSTSSKFAVKVQINNAPVPSFSDSTANGFLNSNEARANTNNLSTITFTDTESDDLNHDFFSFVNPSGQLTTVKSGDTYFVRALNNLSGSTTYAMTASIKDEHGFRTGTTTNTFTIAAAHIGTLGGDTTGYILESATSGDTIRTNTLGHGGSQADLDVSYTNGSNYGGQSVQTFSVFESGSSTPHQFLTSSAAGALSLKSNISESAFTSGTNLTASVVFQDQYQNIGSGSIVVNVTKNTAPTSSFTNNSTFLNSNEARPGNKLLTISFSDAESDSLDHNTFVFTDPSGQLQTTKVGNTYEVFPRNNLSGSVDSGGTATYAITSSIKDEHGFETGVREHTFTIATADLGTLAGTTNSYIIESATSGSLIRVNTNGRTGTQADLNVTYLNSGFGSPSVQRFTVFESNKTTPHQFITSSAVGALSIKKNVSASAYTFNAGTAMTASVVFEDQYQNIKSGSITVNIAKNNPPVITLSPNSQTLPSEKAVSGSFICSASFSDTESDTINFSSFAFGGTHGNLFSASRSGDAMLVIANQDISASLDQYSFNCTVKDVHGFHTSNATSATLNVQPMIYFYKSTNNTLGAFGSVADGYGNFGDPGNDETDYISGSFLGHFRSGSLNNTIGSPTIAIDHYYYSATTLDSKDGFNNHPGSASLVASQSSYVLSKDGSTSVWRQFGQIDLTGNNSRGHTWFVLFPSSSAIGQKPGTMGTEMSSPYPAHEYVVWSDNAASDTVESAGLMYFSLNDGVEINGANRWGIIFGIGGNNSAQYYHLLTSSGSSPSSEM